MPGCQESSSGKETSTDVIRLKPYQYLHVLDNNTNISDVVVGPTTFTRQQHQEVLCLPKDCIAVPHMHYCVVENPVILGADGHAMRDNQGAIKYRRGDSEIRFTGEPFVLYPEEVFKTFQPLQVLKAGKALKLQCLRDFESVDGSGQKVQRVAGDIYQFVGPGTYYPHICEELLEEVAARVVLPGEALKLQAIIGFTDRTGTLRKAGDQWLITKQGSYLPAAEERVLDTLRAIILDAESGVHVKALCDFVDQWGRQRHTGEQWLITGDTTESYIPTPEEEVVEHVKLTVLEKHQYCVVLNCWDSEGKIRLGARELRSGPTTFFLMPGEVLDGGKCDAYILGEQEAVLIRSREDATVVKDGVQVPVKAGERWMVTGPCMYVPSITEEVLERREAVPLAENEGLYVRNIITGKVRVVRGQTYMLTMDEELWEKELAPIVEERLMQQGGSITGYIDAKKAKAVGRDKTRLVSYQLPGNTVAQVYDFHANKQRLVFGPDLVQLGPEEELTVQSLSGSEWIPSEPNRVMPKKSGQIKALYLFLGPASLSDVLVVETADHARLRLQVSYDWHFDVHAGDVETAKQVFNVPDFVGDACKQLQSRVRSAVASQPFDTFHKNSAQMIRVAVFGLGADGKVRNQLYFPANRLCVTSIDIQEVECVDEVTRESLQKSVKLAIEITTDSQEQRARQKAEELNQVANGLLERQKLKDMAAVEEERRVLLEYLAESAAIETTGASKAEAQANAERNLIEGEAAIRIAELRAEAMQLQSEAEIEIQEQRRLAELEHLQALNELEIKKERTMANIEAAKFRKCVSSVGQATIASMARAGPEMQARLLKGLGLEGYLMTDGSSPINLMNAAGSLVGGPAVA